MMHQDSLEPTAIRFMFERLQESARRSGYFLPVFSCINMFEKEKLSLTTLSHRG